MAEAYEQTTGRQRLEPLGLAYAVFEAAVHALHTADDPCDRRVIAIATPLARTRLQTMAGVLDRTAGPMPNVVTAPLADGQWQRGKPHELTSSPAGGSTGFPSAATSSRSEPRPDGGIGENAWTSQQYRRSSTEGTACRGSRETHGWRAARRCSPNPAPNYAGCAISAPSGGGR